MRIAGLRAQVAVAVAVTLTVLGVASPAAASTHAVVKNPFTPVGESWVDVPDTDRVWLQHGDDTSVGTELDDNVFSYLPEGTSCILGNGDDLSGPALIDGENDSDCNAVSTAIPIGFELNFAGKTQSSLYVNSNAAIGFTPSNAYDDPLHESSMDDEVSGFSVLGVDLGVYTAGTSTDIPGTNVWVAQTTVDEKQAFVVSWENLRSHGDEELEASVQLVLLNDGNGDFTAWFNYDSFNVNDEGYSSGAFFVDLRNNPDPGVYKAYDVEFLTIPGVADELGCIDIDADVYNKYGDDTGGPAYARVVDATADTVKLLTSCGETDEEWAPGADDRYIFSTVSTATYDEHDSMPIGWGVWEAQEDGTIEWNATELQYNVDVNTLIDSGSNPLINQSLNTNVIGRYVIGMRAGKTWGDPSTKLSQESLSLTVGELPFDGTTTLTLAAAGGSGTGVVSYVVVSGPCEIDGDKLIATGLGTCIIKAIKSSDEEYAQAESEETIFTAVLAELEPQTPGDSELTVNGQPEDVTVEKSQDETGLNVSGSDFTMSLAGTDGQGNPLGVTPDSALILEQTRMAEVSGTGFQGDSEVELYLHSTPLLLGTLTVDANGVFSGTVVIPKYVAAGIHHLQAVGYTADGAIRILTLKVLLRALASTKVKTSAVIDFKIGSALLTKQSKAKLRVVAKLLAGSKANTIKIVGSVQRSKSDYNNRTLSRARARVVKAFLLKIGVRGKFTIVIDDSVWASAKSRKAVLTANYGG